MRPVLALLLVLALLGAACGSDVEGGAPGETSGGTGTDAASDLAVHPPCGDPDFESTVVSFLDVGQGDATLVQAPGATLLVDAGRHDRDDVVGLLDERCVDELDVVVITHPHADHIGQLDRVLDAFPVGEVWMSGNPHTSRTFERAMDAVERTGVVYEEPRAGDTTTVGPLAIEVVHPARLTGDLNDDSVSLRITSGAVSVLVTGDAEANAEAEMVDRDAPSLASTVLRAGHHGSSTSTTPGFLAAVDPAVVVYSAGQGNSYGHPHSEVVDRVRRSGADLFGTDTHGTITLVIDGDRWSVHPERLP